MATSPVAGSSGEVPRASFDGKDAPIRSVVVYTNNMAEIKRVVNFSSATATGVQEVELTGLPSGFVIVEQSVTVKGSGYCTILDVSFSEERSKGAPSELTVEEHEAKKAEKEKAEQKLECLMDEHLALSQQYERAWGMRQLVDRVADRATSCPPVAGGADTAAAASAAAAAAAAAVTASLDVDSVGKALDWWAAKAAETDEQLHRTVTEGRRLAGAIKELAGKQNADRGVGRAPEASKTLTRAVITLDVEELRPIELEVTYLIIGARWSPSYDLRVDTQTNSMSCTYYGRVFQTTTEDWEGVSLRLSTAQPTFHGDPPSLPTKVVSFKPPSVPFVRNVKVETRQRQAAAAGFSFGSSTAAEFSFGSSPAAAVFGVSPAPAPAYAGGGGAFGVNPAQSPGGLFGSAGGESGESGLAEGFHYPAQPPPQSALPPDAKVAMSQVEGGDCGTGSVSFAIGNPATVRGDGKPKKLTIGVLELPTVVTHYIVPSQEPAAYLQAKATNNTDYLLLPSDAVSVFLDNSFSSRTSMAFNSPGETFQAFLGMDPTIQTKIAPPRRAKKKKGIFGKVDHVMHSYSTTVSNRKKVPVTCVIVDSMPHPADESIKVSLEQPASSMVRDSVATTDENLVIAALDMFGGGGEGGQGGTDDAPPSGSHATAAAAAAAASAGETAVSAVQTGVLGVAKDPRSHLAWVVTIAPQEDIQIPFEYTVEWPVGNDVQFTQ